MKNFCTGCKVEFDDKAMIKAGEPVPANFDVRGTVTFINEDGVRCFPRCPECKKVHFFGFPVID